MLGWFNFTPAQVSPVDINWPDLGGDAQRVLDWLGGMLHGSTSPQSAQPPSGSAQGQGGASIDASALQQLLQTTGSGAGGSSGSGPSTYLTPDGVTITTGSPEDTAYQLVDAVWTKYYGAHAPYAMARTFHDLGVQNMDQANQVMQGMPSHIEGPDGSRIPIGQFESMRDFANKLSNQYFGRPVPDSLIQQWAKSGITNPEAIGLWFLNHPANDVPKDSYGAIFDQAQGWAQHLHDQALK